MQYLRDAFRNLSSLCFGEPPLKLHSYLTAGRLDDAYFLQRLLLFLRRDTGDKLPVQPIFYFRADTHSLETNYAPQLPERRRPAVYNDRLRQEVLKCFGKLFESVIYKIPVTSHRKTYSKASLKRDIVWF